MDFVIAVNENLSSIWILSKESRVYQKNIWNLDMWPRKGVEHKRSLHLISPSFPFITSVCLCISTWPHLHALYLFSISHVHTSHISPLTHTFSPSSKLVISLYSHTSYLTPTPFILHPHLLPHTHTTKRSYLTPTPLPSPPTHSPTILLPSHHPFPPLACSGVWMKYERRDILGFGSLILDVFLVARLMSVLL